MADKLGRTVDELRATISLAEFEQWKIWHAKRNARATMRER